eukprot:scaffold52035_cov22-Tisochrysis_lutea.AAC.1
MKTVSVWCLGPYTRLCADHVLHAWRNARPCIARSKADHALHGARWVPTSCPEPRNTCFFCFNLSRACIARCKLLCEAHVMECDGMCVQLESGMKLVWQPIVVQINL